MRKCLLLIPIMLILSCSTMDLSKMIEKSQLKHYRDNGVKNVNEHRIRCMRDARAVVFDSLDAVLENLSDEQTFSLIEGYDISNGELNGVLILREKNYFYHGSCITNKFSFSDAPTIDNKTINFYTDSSSLKLIGEKELSSITYIGTTVKKVEDSKWIFTHKNW